MSSFFDSASLVQIPSGYSDGTLYSVKPIDGSGDLTFSRGSDIEATRVAANGYIEKAKVNLVLQSNSFNTTWSLASNMTLTSGQSGYDGSSDAWECELTISGTFKSVSQSVSHSGVNTFSVYAKAGTISKMTLRSLSGTDAFVIFNLSSGTIQSISSNAITGTMTDAGGGWYRCTVTYSATQSNVYIYMNDMSTPASGTIYIQDAQLNYGLVAQEYQETTTTSVVAGITNDMPRLDYSGGASCPNLLLEPSRSNKNSFDSYFGSWYTLDAITATHNATTSPEGVTNAAFLQRTSSTGNARLQTPIMTVSSGAKVVHSIFLKAGTANNVILYSTQGGEGKKFDLTTGTAGDNFISAPDDYGIESYGNDWYRIWIVSTMPATSAQCWVYIDEAATTGFYAYGFQTEEGSYPTSLIPCNGTSATRLKDLCSKTGISSLIGQTEGTLFIDIDFKNMGTGVVQVIASIDDSANNKRIEIWANGNSVNGFIGATTGGNITIGTTTLTDGHHKLVLAYKQSGDHAFYIDGTQIGTSSTAYTIPSLNNFRLFYWNNALYPQVEYKQAILFPTRLSNADLATLTA